MAQSLEGWVTVFTTGTDYEADLVRDRLDDAGLSAVVLTRRDHAFNLTVGELASVWVLVPPDEEQEARTILNSQPISDAELEAAALAADPDAPSAHDPENQARLDTGIDRISFESPDDD